MLKTFIHITHFLFRTGAFIFSLVSHKLILDVHDTFFLASHHNVEIENFIDSNIQKYTSLHWDNTPYITYVYSV